MSAVFNDKVNLVLELEDQAIARRLKLPFGAESEVFAMTPSNDKQNNLKYLILAPSEKVVERFLNAGGAQPRGEDPLRNVRKDFETASKEKDKALNDRQLRGCCTCSRNVAVLLLGADADSTAVLLDRFILAVTPNKVNVNAIQITTGAPADSCKGR